MIKEIVLKFVGLMPVIASTIAIGSCSTANVRSATGELVGIGTASWSEPAPHGMVLVSRGTIISGQQQPDSLWGTPADAKGVSVDDFWMDETEVTNAEYKQFIFWVRDSILRERLADPAYGGDDEFIIDEDRDGNPIQPRINWKKPIPWRNPNEDEQRAIESLYRKNPLTGAYELDPDQLNYRYEVFNYSDAALRKNRLDPRRREYNTDKPVDYEMPIVSKDTAFINDEGEIVRQTVSRRLSGRHDFVNTYIVNVYPDTTVWINDFENSYNEPYARMYFSNGGYDNYPVVGVSWEQATAFANWRTDLLRKSLGREGVHIEPYRLPTEAEWEYAARAGVSENRYPWNGNATARDSRGCYYANFKPADGGYAKDGNVITSPVGSYAPNNFGLYDMAGNVSEWTSTAFVENVSTLTSDVNPEFRYNAADDDPYRMKRKIIRGGSWKDVANNIRGDIRMWEYQNEQRSYIGFLCVRTHIGFSKGKKTKR